MVRFLNIFLHSNWLSALFSIYFSVVLAGTFSWLLCLCTSYSQVFNLPSALDIKAVHKNLLLSISFLCVEGSLLASFISVYYLRSCPRPCHWSASSVVISRNLSFFWFTRLFLALDVHARASILSDIDHIGKPLHLVPSSSSRDASPCLPQGHYVKCWLCWPPYTGRLDQDRAVDRQEHSVTKTRRKARKDVPCRKTTRQECVGTPVSL